MYLERWAREPRASLDMAPTVFNLIDALLQFLNINKYTATSGNTGHLLVDVFPEVCYRQSEESIVKLALRKGAGKELRSILHCLDRQGCCYVPRLNAFFVKHFEMLPMAEEIASFVHRACRGAIGKAPIPMAEGTAADAFYGAALQHALRTFGSRVLHPSRPVLREEDLYAFYSSPETPRDFDREEFERLIDFLVMHKDYESHRRKYLLRPLLIEQGTASQGRQLEYLTARLGELLGNEIYEAYLAGLVSKRALRALFFRDLTPSGAAESAYFAAARKCVPHPRRSIS